MDLLEMAEIQYSDLFLFRISRCVHTSRTCRQSDMPTLPVSTTSTVRFVTIAVWRC